MNAPAKINLFLKITGKRPDGYHDLETIFLSLEKPADEISVSPADCLQITSSDNHIPTDENNLCFQAAVEFAKFANIEPAWHIDIQKNIPIAAGVGGGSSDAAAVLQLLNEMHPGLSHETIAEIALGLGADVPFFFDPKPSFARGIGEKLTPMENIPKIPLVLLNPRFPISAAWGFKNFTAHGKNSDVEDMVEVLQQADYGKLDEIFCNDLQTAVFAKFPIMGILKSFMLEAGAVFVGMSGSGPTLFAVCESNTSAVSLSDMIISEFGDAVFCLATSTINSKSESLNMKQIQNPND